MIWHDVINNSVSRHRSNNFNRLSEDRLVAILKRYNAKTSAIAYCQRTKIEEIFEKFKESGILTISIIDDLTSKRKAKDKRLRKQYLTLQQHDTLEIKTFRIISRYGKT